MSKSQESTAAKSARSQKSKRYIEVYKANDGRYYWRAVVRASRKTVFTSESHPTRARARRDVLREWAILGIPEQPEIRNIELTHTPMRLVPIPLDATRPVDKQTPPLHILPSTGGFLNRAA
jgi:uncharacterized protein YegP (UPF0339 family)